MRKRINHSGKTIGPFLILEDLQKKGKVFLVLAKCLLCNSVKEYVPSKLIRGQKSCGCQTNRKYYSGKIINKFLILKDLLGNPAKVLARCPICQSEKQYTARNLMRTKTKSCGCVLSGYRHGHAVRVKKSRTYTIWDDMMARAHKKNRHIDPRWKKFKNFLADMGTCPIGLTLDRKDNDEGYFLANCHWATRSCQNHNRRPFNKLKAKGVSAIGNKYVAQITKNRKVYHLGTFNTIEEASTAYKKKAKKLYPEIYED